MPEVTQMGDELDPRYPLPDHKQSGLGKGKGGGKGKKGGFGSQMPSFFQ